MNAPTQVSSDETIPSMKDCLNLSGDNLENNNLQQTDLQNASLQDNELRDNELQNVIDLDSRDYSITDFNVTDIDILDNSDSIVDDSSQIVDSKKAQVTIEKPENQQAVLSQTDNIEETSKPDDLDEFDSLGDLDTLGDLDDLEDWDDLADLFAEAESDLLTESIEEVTDTPLEQPEINEDQINEVQCTNNSIIVDEEMMVSTDSSVDNSVSHNNEKSDRDRVNEDKSNVDLTDMDLTDTDLTEEVPTKEISIKEVIDVENASTNDADKNPEDDSNSTQLVGSESSISMLEGDEVQISRLDDFLLIVDDGLDFDTRLDNELSDKLNADDDVTTDSLIANDVVVTDNNIHEHNVIIGYDNISTNDISTDKEEVLELNDDNGIDGFLLIEDDELEVEECQDKHTDTECQAKELPAKILASIGDVKNNTNLKDFVLSHKKTASLPSVVQLDNADVATAVARIVEYSPNHYIALPTHVTMELIDNPQVQLIPGATRYTDGLINWQNQWVPLIDLSKMLSLNIDEVTQADDGIAHRFYALILAYQPLPKMPLNYIAIRLKNMPDSIAVTDEQACELPNNAHLDDSHSGTINWQSIAHSCIMYNDVATPIISTTLLFTTQKTM